MSRLDTSKSMGQVFGQSPVAFTQGGKYFNGKGEEIPYEDVLLSSEEYSKKYPSQKHEIVVKAKAADDSPPVQVIGNPDAKYDGGQAAAAGRTLPAPEKSEDELRVDLANMNAAQVKKLVIAANIEPETGKGSMARNVELLIGLDHPGE